jgi:hypothetical protein
MREYNTLKIRYSANYTVHGDGPDLSVHTSSVPARTLAKGALKSQHG